jgi:hypothetical protein
MAYGGRVLFTAVPHLPVLSDRNMRPSRQTSITLYAMTSPIVDSCSSVRLCSAQAADQLDVTLAPEELNRGFEQAQLSRALVEGRCAQ